MTTDFDVDEEPSAQDATCRGTTTLADKRYHIHDARNSKQQKGNERVGDYLRTKVGAKRSDFSKRKTGNNTVNYTAGASSSRDKADSFPTSVLNVRYTHVTKRLAASICINRLGLCCYKPIDYNEMFTHDKVLTQKGYETAAALQQELIRSFNQKHGVSTDEINEALKKKGKFDEKRQCYVQDPDKPKKTRTIKRITSLPIDCKYIPYSNVSYRPTGCIFLAQLTHNNKGITFSRSFIPDYFSNYWDQENTALTDTGKDFAKCVQKSLIDKIRKAYPTMTLDEQHDLFLNSTYDETEGCYYKATFNIPDSIKSCSFPVYGISYYTLHERGSHYLQFKIGKLQISRKQLTPVMCSKFWDEDKQCLTAYGLELAESLQQDGLQKHKNDSRCSIEINLEKVEYCRDRNVYYKKGKKPPNPDGPQSSQTLGGGLNITDDPSDSLPYTHLPDPEPPVAEPCNSEVMGELSEASLDGEQSSSNDTIALSNTFPSAITVKQEPELAFPIPHEYHNPELTFRNKAKTTLCRWMARINKKTTVREYDSLRCNYVPFKNEQDTLMYEAFLKEWFCDTPSHRAQKEKRLVTVKKIPYDDPRVGLRNQKGLFASEEGIQANCILGVFSGTYMLYSHKINDRTDIKAEVDFLQENYHCGSDAYGNYTISIALNENSILTVSSLHKGAACSFINAPATNDSFEEVSTEVNTVFKIVMLKGQPPVVVAVTTKPIAGGQEIITHYGKHYWESHECGRTREQPINIPLDDLEQLPEKEQLNSDDRVLYTEDDIKQAMETAARNKKIKHKAGNKRQHSIDGNTERRENPKRAKSSKTS